MTDTTASLLEVLSVIANLLGIWAAWTMLSKTRARHVAVRLEPDYDPDGPRVLAAWRHYRCEGARIAYHVATLALGLWSMLLPDPVAPYGMTAMWVRAILSVGFTLMSVLDLRTDGRLWELLGSRRRTVQP